MQRNAPTDVSDLEHLQEHEPMRRKRVILEYNLTYRQFYRMKITGLLKGVDAPKVIHDSKHVYVARSEMESWAGRLQRFKDNFVPSKHIGNWLSISPGVSYRKNAILVRAKKNGVIFHIGFPPSYLFHHSINPHWHITDLKLFQSFWIKRSTGDLKPPDSKKHRCGEILWQPDYQMPIVEEFKHLYTQDTMQTALDYQSRRESLSSDQLSEDSLNHSPPTVFQP